MNPKISIIIPAYNASLTILETLESVKNQSYENFECVIIDDGSTDETVSLIERFCNKDLRFKFYLQENKGPFHARLKGVKQSKGEWITFVDSDDVLKPEALITFFKYSDLHTDIIISPLGIEKDIKKLCGNFLNIEDYRKMIYYGYPISVGMHSKLYRKKLFNEMREDVPFKLIRGEDMLMNIILSFNTQKDVFIIKEKVYEYRIRENGLTNTFYYKPISDIQRKSNLEYVPEEYRDEFKVVDIKSRFRLYDGLFGYKLYIPNEWLQSELIVRLCEDVKKNPLALSFIKRKILFSTTPIKRWSYIQLRKILNIFHLTK